MAARVAAFTTAGRGALLASRSLRARSTCRASLRISSSLVTGFTR